jgi:ppGpp synthetase/RelA/SpoT-type nucleotidyltranferase
MIIPKTIEAFYSKLTGSLQVLKYEVDQTLGNIATPPNIVYVQARIKPKESLLAKIEKEGYENPANEIEDLVACTLIVNKTSMIDTVKKKVEEKFNVEDEKSKRSRSPNEFIYDATHLILTFKDGPLISNKSILGRKFELQIRTDLQNAIEKVTREEIYKTDTLTWQKDRTASEIRANLELLDLLLDSFPQIDDFQEERKYGLYQTRNKIIDLLKDVWSAEKLPKDLRRASIIIEEYLRLADAQIEDLTKWLKLDTHRKRVEAVSITPSQIVLSILFLEKKDRFLQNVRIRKRRLLVTPEMLDVCPELKEIETSFLVNIE